MKATARSLLSATTALGLTAFSLVAAFSPFASASVAATSFGLLVVYGLLEMSILSYTTRRVTARASAPRLVAMPAETVRGSTVVEFPARPERACAA